MHTPITRPFESLGNNDRILFLEHDITLPYCFDLSDSSEIDDDAVAEA